MMRLVQLLLSLLVLLAPAVHAAPAVPPIAANAVAAPAEAAHAPTPAATRATRPDAARQAQADAQTQALRQGLAEAPEVETTRYVRITLILTLMAVLPALVICMTCFLRIIVTLSIIRHAFGMPETPPNAVLTSLALFLTAFAMMPTVEAVNGSALQPFLNGSIGIEQAMDAGADPLRTFMLKQVRDEDIKVIYQISNKPLPARAEDVELMRLVPAFMLNELRVAFRIGFVILLPFLLIDLVVSSILLALGMLMVPPSTLSLPLKVLMFVLIDGWSLVLQGVLGSIIR